MCIFFFLSLWPTLSLSDLPLLSLSLSLMCMHRAEIEPTWGFFGLLFVIIGFKTASYFLAACVSFFLSFLRRLWLPELTAWVSSTLSPVPFTSMCGFHDYNKLTNRMWECNRDFESDWVVWLIVLCLCYQWDKVQEILGRVWEAHRWCWILL